jgi:hypothetical protein
MIWSSSFFGKLGVSCGEGMEGCGRCYQGSNLGWIAKVQGWRWGGLRGKTYCERWLIWRCLGYILACQGVTSNGTRSDANEQRDSEERCGRNNYQEKKVFKKGLETGGFSV